MERPAGAITANTTSEIIIDVQPAVNVRREQQTNAVLYSNLLQPGPPQSVIVRQGRCDTLDAYDFGCRVRSIGVQSYAIAP